MKFDQTEAPAIRLARLIVFLAAVAIVTAVMFGPSSGFHHQYGFGRPVMYMVLNGEDPDPESFQIDGMEVVFNPAAFAALFFVWLMISVSCFHWFGKREGRTVVTTTRFEIAAVEC